MDRKERPFSIVGDIKKAHRRFKHLAKEQGLLACQLDARDGPAGQLNNSCVYINMQGGRLRRELRQLLVDPHRRVRDKGYTPSPRMVPDRHAPVRERPGVASHHPEGGG